MPVISGATARAMQAELESLLSEVGHAKVIAVLRAGTVAATAAAAERSLKAYFQAPSREEAESLSRAAENFASKRFTRSEALAERCLRLYPRLGLAVGFVTEAGAAGLAADERVTALVPAPELSLIKPVEMTPARAKAGATWGIERLNVPKLWEAGMTGKGVVVGHLDTGVDATHPVLRGAIASFAEFDLAGDRVTGARPWDSGDHGTHTAGTIVGRPSGQSRVGVAPGARLASAMVIEGGQVLDRILAGMEWIVGQKARILSMSLGLRGYTPAFQVVIDALRNQNVLPVIAVGNEGPRTSRSPGNYANVLSVGACDAQDRVADFSSSQSFRRADDPLVPDLVAPGVDVLSCVPDRGYARMNGTSMATPHVAGVAALLLQAMRGASVDALESALLASCRRPGSMPEGRANRGIPDAPSGLRALTGRPLPQAPPVSRRKASRGRRTARGKASRQPGRRRAARATRRAADGSARKAGTRRTRRTRR
jgi:subtilisin family serine protease